MDRGLKEWRLKLLNANNVQNFYYFSYIDNLDSILKHGILPKNRVIREGHNHSSFADEYVQGRRQYRNIVLTDKRSYSTHDLVPLYLCPTTPTLSARRGDQDKFFMIRIQSTVLIENGVEFAFTDGNAAARDTRPYTDLRDLDQLPWDVIKADYWNDFTDGKRKRCTEFLIHPLVPISYFAEIGVNNPQALQKVNEIFRNNSFEMEASIKPNWYFEGQSYDDMPF